jgi:dihydroorotate dehydrogenase (NAD+) catalytic subunit
MRTVSKANLECKFAGLRLKNPLVLASGIIGTSATLLERAAQCGAGAVISKSCSLAAREGHANPVAVDWGHGVINAIGLTNLGAAEEARMLVEAKSKLYPLGVPIIASIFAGTLEEFGITAKVISQANPDMIEVNISCPNVADEFGTPFAATEKSAAEVTEAVRKSTDIPISVKLAPNVYNIGRIAKAVEAAGADAITAINTMPGMVIDARAGRPVLSNRTGGISGAAIKPIALRCVAEIAQNVKVPIIGTGGVMSGMDTAEMIMAGATAVGIGTAVWYRGVEAFNQIKSELETFMEEEGYRNLDEMRGKAIR